MIATETYEGLRLRPASESETRASADRELARRAGRGDKEAFAELYRRHHAKVFSLCLRLTQNAALAEDLTQEVFIQLYRKIASFRGDSAFTTYLHRVAVNQTLMYLRKSGVKFEQTTEDGETPEQKVTGYERRGDSAFVNRLTLEAAISKLAPGYRTVLVLFDLEGFSHEEIATLLKCSVGTTKSQLHKARMKLRELLLSPGGVSDPTKSEP